MSRGPLVQVVLVVCGLLAVVVMWDERKHQAALVWAAGWTACCWLLAPAGWARWAPLALSVLALLVTTCAVRRSRAQRRAGRHTDLERQLELLLAPAEREQSTTIATVAARLRAHADAARLLAAHDLDRPLPAPPAEPRPGSEELWRRLDDAHRIAVATHIAAGAELVKGGAAPKTLFRVAGAADELARAIEIELGATRSVSCAVPRTENPWQPTLGDAA